VKVGDPITVVLLAPDPYELIDAVVVHDDGYAAIYWHSTGVLVEQKGGRVHVDDENVDWARGHGDDVRAMLLLSRSV
jgi:hypothetical protein